MASSSDQTPDIVGLIANICETEGYNLEDTIRKALAFFNQPHLPLQQEGTGTSSDDLLQTLTAVDIFGETKQVPYRSLFPGMSEIVNL